MNLYEMISRLRYLTEMNSLRSYNTLIALFTIVDIQWWTTWLLRKFAYSSFLLKECYTQNLFYIKNIYKERYKKICRNERNWIETQHRTKDNYENCSNLQCKSKILLKISSKKYFKLFLLKRMFDILLRMFFIGKLNSMSLTELCQLIIDHNGSLKIQQCNCEDTT